jgi:hypothetical protein
MGMVLAQGDATNLYRLEVEQLGLGGPAHRVVQQRQVVQRLGVAGVPLPQGRAINLGLPIAGEKKTTNLVYGPSSNTISLLETRLRGAESRNLIRECLSRIEIPRNLVDAT